MLFRSYKLMFETNQSFKSRPRKFAVAPPGSSREGGRQGLDEAGHDGLALDDGPVAVPAASAHRAPGLTRAQHAHHQTHVLPVGAGPEEGDPLAGVLDRLRSRSASS